MNQEPAAHGARRHSIESLGLDVDAHQKPARSDAILFRAGLGMVLVAFGAFLWASVSALRQLADANDASLRAVEVLRKVDGLTEQATRIENSFHGYLLTHAVRHQVAWQEAQTEAWGKVRAVRADTTLTGEQSRHLDTIESLMKSWLAVHESMLREATAPPETAGRVAADTARLADAAHLRRQIDTHAETVQRIEATRLNVIYVQAEAQQRRALVYATLAAGLIPFLLLGVAHLSARRAARLEAVVRTLDYDGEERREVEASLERLARRHRVILDAAADGIIEVDAAGTVTFLNPSALRILAIRGKHAAGQSYQDVLFGGTGSDVEVGQATATQQAVEIALRNCALHADANGIFLPRGEAALPVELQVAPMTSAGRLTGAVLTFRDVRAQRELALQRNQLLGILSHELRTPLTSVRGSLGLIAAGPVGTLDERGRGLLDIAVHNTDRLMRTISDILDVERIERGRFDLERGPVAVRALIAEAVTAVTGEADRAGVTIAVDADDVMVHADRDRIAQVVIHLLENAIKFSPRGSATRIEVREDAGSARFTVSDQGEGIPADLIPRIFDRYLQVDGSDSRRRGGAGLGLTLSRGIVQEHGAELTVASTPGKGSTFGFVIPLSAALRADPDRDTRDARPALDRQAVA